MNQNQIQQLTLHLSQALDQNYDVVNMEAVLSVICALEGTTITKDQLEATRLAKYINQLRRRTKNEQLARRAKSLLKKWREMVGIQQQTNDSQSQTQTQFQSQLQKATTDNNNDVVVDTSSSSLLLHQHQHQQHQQQQYVISDSQSNLDAFPMLDNNDETPTQTHNQNQFQSQSQMQMKKQKKSGTFVNEHSSSSISNHQVNSQAAIVIDIVSDSDDNDNDNDNSKFAPSLTPTTQALALPLPLPANPIPYPRPKKVKKDKRRKEKAQHSSLFNIKEAKSATDSNCFPDRDNKATFNYPADSEILSLSNSSMSSSFLSGDPLSANSQNKQQQRTSSDLSFAGRFKSVSQMSDNNATNVNANVDNSQLLAMANGTKIHDKFSVEQPQAVRQIYEDYINNDSSTSCSRLSPFEELEAKQSQHQSQSQSQSHLKSFVEPNNKQQMPRLLALKPDDDSHENAASQLPKKRGRKKGSKGVDSVIANKESRLSQQILFGSGVKKVKTTKELFNEIQGRKPSISFHNHNPAANNNQNQNQNQNQQQQRNQNRESSRSLIPRPTSSCSETSMHSPQISETYSTNNALSGIESKFSNILEDTGNTDSDTITSEPSRDSMKSGELKRRSPSMDSISNSMQTCSVRNAIGMSSGLNNNSDVTTQLMHLVNSLNSPLSVTETEQLYQSQIVPCTCIILEEMQNANQLTTDEMDNEIAELKTTDESDNNNKEMAKNSEQKQSSLNKTDKDKTKTEETILAVPAKHKKSIFDLDFDDEDDPLHAIITNLTNSNVQTHNDYVDDDYNANANDNDAKFLNEVPAVVVPEDEDGEKLPETLSIYTVQEDPDCVAKQRFSVQTNSVNNYHINALHNYYVANINGNWNDIDSTLNLQTTVTEFQVKDGSDVVPTYGSLTYDHIPKDLSCCKFRKHFERKLRKSSKSKTAAIFLGVAKCLPACRRAKREIKREISPLKVEIGSSSHQLLASSNVSCNLLQLANTNNNNNNNDYEDEQPKDQSSSSSTCSDSSLPSNQLKKQRDEHIERNIVERNRKKRRKKAKVLDTADDVDNVAKPQIKRIKIAINGNVATTKQITDDEDENDDDDDEVEMDVDVDKSEEEDHEEQESIRSQSTTIDDVENEADYNDDNSNNADGEDQEGSMEEEYAIVQRPLMVGSSSNHIVLTIKKTPSKINSPVNSINSSAAISPIMVNQVETAKYINFKHNNNNINEHNIANDNANDNDNANANDNTNANQAPMSATCLNSYQPCYRYRRRYRYRYRCRQRRAQQQLIGQKETIDLELKHLFNTNHNNNNNNNNPSKTHQKLFFANELNCEDQVGRKQRIINYSSSSSNYEDDDDDDDDNDNDDDRSDEASKLFANNAKLKFETEAKNAKQLKQEQDTDLSASDESDSDNDDDGDEDGDDNANDNGDYDDAAIGDELDNKNNGMLPSFNAIYNQNVNPISISTADDDVKLQIANCDAVNSYINNNNNNLSVTKSHMNNNNEHRTGIRSKIENDSPKMQEFKEWHQVLQLQSYNNEPLIVLPYVVLE